MGPLSLFHVAQIAQKLFQLLAALETNKTLLPALKPEDLFLDAGGSVQIVHKSQIFNYSDNRLDIVSTDQPI